MKNLSIFVVIAVVAALLMSGCMSAVRHEGTFTGRVIDADTGEPVEGAVVLATWSREYSTVAGAVSKFYDARETVTDRKGDFSIPGMGLEVMSNVLPMDVVIFKAGYNYIRGSKETFKVSFIISKKIKWEGDNPIIPLKKLTMKERKERGGPPAPPFEAPLEKVILMLREIDKNDKERGLPTRDIWKGQRYE